jgi:hypothetical protein
VARSVPWRAPLADADLVDQLTTEKGRTMKRIGIGHPAALAAVAALFAAVSFDASRFGGRRLQPGGHCPHCHDDRGR